jgi:hypothetical protein
MLYHHIVLLPEDCLHKILCSSCTSLACIVRLMLTCKSLYNLLAADAYLWTVMSTQCLSLKRALTWEVLSKKMRDTHTRCYECGGINGRNCLTVAHKCILLCVDCASHSDYRRLVTRRFVSQLLTGTTI